MAAAVFTNREGTVTASGRDFAGFGRWTFGSADLALSGVCIVNAAQQSNPEQAVQAH